MSILNKLSLAVLVALAGSGAARASDDRTLEVHAAQDPTAPYYVLITEQLHRDKPVTYTFELCSTHDGGCKSLGNQPQYQLRDLEVRMWLHHAQAKGRNVLTALFHRFRTYPLANGGLVYVIAEQVAGPGVSAVAGLAEIYVPMTSTHHEEISQSLQRALHVIAGDNDKVTPLPKGADLARFAANLDMALRQSVDDTLTSMLIKAEQHHQAIVYDRYIN